MKINKGFKIALAVATVASVGISAHAAGNLLSNGSFEAPDASGPIPFVAEFSGGGAFIKIYDEANVPDWSALTGTVDPGLLEIWQPNGVGSVQPVEGNQFAELNSFVPTAYYQDVTVNNGDDVSFAFEHRARDNNGEQIRMRITDLGADGIWQPTDLVVYNFEPTAVVNAWTGHNGVDIFTGNGNDYRFSFRAIGSFPDPSRGNFIDNVQFGVNVVPEPTSLMLLGFGSMFLLRRRRK